MNLRLLKIFLLGFSLVLANQAYAQNKGQAFLAQYLNPIEPMNPKIGQFIYCRNIYFDLDAPRLLSQSYKALDSISSIIRLHPRWMIEISVHFDCRGRSAHDSVSRYRAEAIRDYLTYQGGCLASSLVAEGYGSHKPIVVCNNCGLMKQAMACIAKKRILPSTAELNSGLLASGRNLKLIRLIACILKSGNLGFYRYIMIWIKATSCRKVRDV